MLTILLPYRDSHTYHFLTEAQELFQDNFNILGLDKFLKTGLPNDCTVCMPRLGGVYERFEEAIELLKKYEEKGIVIYPNVSAMITGRHKDIFYKRCQEIDTPIPDTYTIDLNKKLNLDSIIFEGPYICKPSVGSGGKGIIKADTKKDLLNIITLIQQKQLETENYLNKIIIQKFIENNLGYPISTRIFVLNNEVTCSTKILSKIPGAVSNVTSGGVVIPNIATEKEKQLALKICNYIDLEFTAIDFVHDKYNNPYVLEANISPEVFKTHKLNKIHHPRMIYNFLQKEYGI